MSKTYHTVPLGEKYPIEFYVKTPHHSMTYDQLSSELTRSCWQPLKMIVRNYDFFQQNKDIFSEQQLFKLIQFVRPGLFGSLWFIVLE